MVAWKWTKAGTCPAYFEMMKEGKARSMATSAAKPLLPHLWKQNKDGQSVEIKACLINPPWNTETPLNFLAGTTGELNKVGPVKDPD